METHAPLVVEPVVCLIDGDPAVRDSLQALTSLHGHAVRCYSTARAFFEAAHPAPLRCVICEAWLPDGRGIEVHQALVAKGLFVPFVLLVSRDNEHTRSEARDCGISLVIAKPIMDASPLLDFVRAQLDGVTLTNSSADQYDN